MEEVNIDDASKNNITNKQWALLLPVIMLLMAMFKMPYFYYFYLRMFLFLFSIYCILEEFKTKKNIFIIFIFFLISLFFNPFIPVQLERQLWSYIDMFSLLLYLFYFFKTIKYFEKRKNLLLNFVQKVKEKVSEWSGVLGLIAICILSMYVNSHGRLFLSQEKILELDKQDYQQAIADGEICSPEDVKEDNYTSGCRVMTFDDYLTDKEQKEDDESESRYDY